MTHLYVCVLGVWSDKGGYVGNPDANTLLRGVFAVVEVTEANHYPANGLSGHLLAYEVSTGYNFQIMLAGDYMYKRGRWQYGAWGVWKKIEFVSV